MKIALLAPIEEPVPPKKYGGTELVVANLAEMLVQNGHEVHLLASGDSTTSAVLHPLFKESIRVLPEAQDAKVREGLKIIGVGKAIEILNTIQPDIIHNHIGWRFLPFQKLLPAPLITTLHGPLDAPYLQTMFTTYKDSHYVSISNAQREPLPSLNFTATVYNGIAVEQFEYNDSPEDYLAFLGRMSPEKGPVDAIKIALAAGKRLIMAAKVDAADKAYFDKEVAPLIDGKQIQFLGEVDHQGKNKLLKNAIALLAPINWREPFGLFFVEAMATGTPVLTRPRGAAPEIVIPGKTGFLCNTNEDLVAAVANMGTISRAECRSHVEKKFSREHMASGYEAAYRPILA